MPIRNTTTNDSNLVSNNGSNYVSDSTTNNSNNIKQAPMEKYKGDTGKSLA